MIVYQKKLKKATERAVMIVKEGWNRVFYRDGGEKRPVHFLLSFGTAAGGGGLYRAREGRIMTIYKNDQPKS